MTAATESAKPVETFSADAQQSVNAQMEKLTRSFEDIAAFNQDSADALMQASGAAVKAVEELNAEAVSYSRKAIDDGVAAAKEFAAARDVAELAEKQAEFARQSLDGFFQQAALMNELLMTAAKAAMEPLAARATAAADLVKPRQQA